MLADTCQWRRKFEIFEGKAKQTGINTLVSYPLEVKKLLVIRRCRPSSYVGFDRLGRPVFIDRVGLLDQPAMVAAGVTEDDYIAYHILEMEFFLRWMLPKASAMKEKAANGVVPPGPAGKSAFTVDTSMNVVDVSSLQLSMFTKAVRDIFKRMSSIDSDNYPETMGNTFVVGAGFVFQTCWKVLSAFVDPYTRSKIKVLGSGKSAIDMLHKYIPPDVLPKFLGGAVDFEKQRRAWARKFDQFLETEAQKEGNVWMDEETARHLNEYYRGGVAKLPAAAERAGSLQDRRRRSSIERKATATSGIEPIEVSEDEGRAVGGALPAAAGEEAAGALQEATEAKPATTWEQTYQIVAGLFEYLGVLPASWSTSGGTAGSGSAGEGASAGGAARGLAWRRAAAPVMAANAVAGAGAGSVAASEPDDAVHPPHSPHVPKMDDLDDLPSIGELPSGRYDEGDDEPGLGSKGCCAIM